VLTSEIITRGTIRFGLPQPISIVPSNLKSGVGLIATLPRPNATIREGEIFLTVSGRPVFALRGGTPTFRDKSPGSTGDDVQQLEQALARLGFDPGSIDGNYDQKTSAAVERWYRDSGREPFGPTREQKAAILALEAQLAAARRAKIAAEAARDTALRAVAAARALAEQKMRQAELDSAANAKADGERPSTSADQSLALQTERARAAHALSAADAEVAKLLSERALIVLDPRQTKAARTLVDTRLKAAHAARRKAKLEAQLAVQRAAREAALSGRRTEIAEAAMNSARLEGDHSIQASKEQQRLAEFDHKVASERVERLEREYETARGRLGYQVPADEVVFLPALPVRVHEVTALVGAKASGQVMSVTDNKLSIDSRLPIETAPLVKPGMKVAIDEQALGIRATGTVETIANTPGTRGLDGYHYYLGVKLDDAPSRNLTGLSVRLTIPVQSTKGAVTVVPTSSLWLAADGTTRVQVARGGTLQYIAVRPGLSTGGFTEVTAREGRLEPGDLVVAGETNSESK
jgi:peptidoglycan hydrolase-like protein with peptidoglycan-binding domain